MSAHINITRHGFKRQYISLSTGTLCLLELNVQGNTYICVKYEQWLKSLIVISFFFIHGTLKVTIKVGKIMMWGCTGVFSTRTIINTDKIFFNIKILWRSIFYVWQLVKVDEVPLFCTPYFSFLIRHCVVNCTRIIISNHTSYSISNSSIRINAIMQTYPLFMNLF